MTVKRAHVRILVRTHKQAGIIKLTTHTHTHTHTHPSHTKGESGREKALCFLERFSGGVLCSHRIKEDSTD